MGTYSSDAAEEVVRIALEGGEVVARLAGTGAKELAVLLYAVLTDQKRKKGKIRLTNLLRSGKELKVFAIQTEDLAKFCKEAKKYGVLYTVLKDKSIQDGLTDIIVRAEDAGKINRIFERFKFATVDMASIKTQVERDRKEKEMTGESVMLKKDDTEEFLDMLFAGQKEDSEEKQNPSQARTTAFRQSGHSLKSSSQNQNEHLSESSAFSSRPSVKQELNDIRKKLKEHETAEKTKQKVSRHIQPGKKKKPRKRGR